MPNLNTAFSNVQFRIERNYPQRHSISFTAHMPGHDRDRTKFPHQQRMAHSAQKSGGPVVFWRHNSSGSFATLARDPTRPTGVSALNRCIIFLELRRRPPCKSRH
ncbi:MAG: hypothetical protein WA728_32205, partial [Xanthobacteraceae bacterium]